MYIPSMFARTDADDLRALIRDHGFATLVTVDGDGPVASHLPLFLVDDGSPHGLLCGHMARANRQWRHFAGGGEALAVFTGPHTYISPTWYGSDGHVPTWNYAVVHAHGAPRLVGDDRAREILERLVDQYEAGQPVPWRLADLDAEYAAGLLAAIVAFEIPIARLEGKWKVGQNRNHGDRTRAADALIAQGGEDATAVAALMHAVLDSPARRT